MAAASGAMRSFRLSPPVGVGPRAHLQRAQQRLPLPAARAIARSRRGNLCVRQSTAGPEHQPFTLDGPSRRIMNAKLYFHEMWNESNIEVLGSIASPDIMHSDRVWCDYDLVGMKRVRRLYESYMAGFPDCHFEITAIGSAEVLSSTLLDAMDTCVMVRWEFRGTNLGEMWDAPATGRHSQYTGVHVLHFDENDRIRHIESYREPSQDERQQMMFCLRD